MLFIPTLSGTDTTDPLTEALDNLSRILPPKSITNLVKVLRRKIELEYRLPSEATYLDGSQSESEILDDSVEMVRSLEESAEGDDTLLNFIVPPQRKSSKRAVEIDLTDWDDKRGEESGDSDPFGDSESFKDSNAAASSSSDAASDSEDHSPELHADDIEIVEAGEVVSCFSGISLIFQDKEQHGKRESTQNKNYCEDEGEQEEKMVEKTSDAIPVKVIFPGLGGKSGLLRCRFSHPSLLYVLLYLLLLL
jgi:hypothetical protein